MHSSYAAVVAPRVHLAAGLEYLTLATVLLQTARRMHATAGLWEAADLQWWWRRDQHPDLNRQVFWLDDDTAIAAVIVTDWGDRYALDVLYAGRDPGEVLDVVWPIALGRIDALRDARVELAIRDDDHALIGAATAGFGPTDDVTVTTWMAASERPDVKPLPSGFRLASRTEDTTRPHHLRRRNGDQIATRLSECSLYQPALDLAVYSPDGDVAAYGLFWADPVTGVGLVEPMRTEDRYQRRGLAHHVLTVGLDRLAAHGCTRFKVGYIVGNEASRRLYLGAAFTPESTSRTYRRR